MSPFVLEVASYVNFAVSEVIARDHFNWLISCVKLGHSFIRTQGRLSNNITRKFRKFSSLNAELLYVEQHLFK